MRSVAVEIEGNWGGDPIRARNLTYSATVEARAPDAEIQELIAHTDHVAPIHNLLQMGADVTLINGRAISVD